MTIMVIHQNSAGSTAAVRRQCGGSAAAVRRQYGGSIVTTLISELICELKTYFEKSISCK